MRNSFFLIVFLITLFFSCSNESSVENGQINISITPIPTNESNGRITSEVPSKISISIESDIGELILSEIKFDLTPFGSGYSVEPILIEVGNYTITKFLVLNENEEIIYATPLSPSSLSSLVDNPLPISLEVRSDNATQLPLEVISTSGLDPEDLGYASLKFDIIPITEVLISVFENSPIGYILTGADLTVYGDTDSIFTVTLGDSINVVKIRSDFSEIDFRVTKHGYDNQFFTFSIDEVLYYRTAPLDVLFNENLSRGLVAYYPFSGNANDKSGNDLNGQILGAVLSSDRSGSENSAFYFDGINDRIEVGYNDILALQNFTLSAWIRAEEDTVAVITFSEFAPVDNNCGYYMGLIGGKLRGTNNVSGYTWTANVDDDIIPLNEWHHIAYTFDGQNMVLYIDGMETSRVNSPHSVNYSERNNMQLGTYATQLDGTWFKGNLDEIRIYDRALDSYEIQSLSNIE